MKRFINFLKKPGIEFYCLVLFVMAIIILPLNVLYSITEATKTKNPDLILIGFSISAAVGIVLLIPKLMPQIFDIKNEPTQSSQIETTTAIRLRYRQQGSYEPTPIWLITLLKLTAAGISGVTITYPLNQLANCSTVLPKISTDLLQKFGGDAFLIPQFLIGVFIMAITSYISNHKKRHSSIERPFVCLTITFILINFYSLILLVSENVSLLGSKFMLISVPILLFVLTNIFTATLIKNTRLSA